jgi:hypothetical protein
LAIQQNHSNSLRRPEDLDETPPELQIKQSSKCRMRRLLLPSALIVLAPYSAFAAPLTQSERDLTRLVENFTQERTQSST